MTRNFVCMSLAAALVVCGVAGATALGQSSFAGSVASYDPGAAPNLTNPAAALGKPADLMGVGDGWPAILNPFSPHYESTQIVRVGEGGQITLRLERYARPLAGAPEIGIFENVMLNDVDYPNGQADNPVSVYDLDSALVSVSRDGLSWVDLSGGDPIVFGIPSNYYRDLPSPGVADPTGLTPADFGKPFAGTLNDFSGKNWPQILALLDGSTGGTWLDISGTGLEEVGYVRFRMPDDGDAGTSLTLELDAVSVNSLGVGEVVPEPCTLALVGLGGLALVRRRR